VPIVIVAVELSNGRKEKLYYPSSIVLEYLKEKDYSLSNFIEIAMEALEESQKRVVEKYGHQCIGCYFIKQKLNNWCNEFDRNIIVSVRKIEHY